MNSEEMDWTYLDQLAWFKVIMFLDKKSRLNCRLQSRIIKDYIDHVGLNLRISDLSVLESPRKEAWQKFLSTPGLYFNRVHVITNMGNDPLDLGLRVNHQVEYLKISGFVNLDWILKADWTVNLDWILKADWTKNINILSLHGSALATCPFLERDTEATILIPYLEKLFVNIHIDDIDGVSRAEAQRITNLQVQSQLSNLEILLRRIRGQWVRLICVDVSLRDSRLDYEIQDSNSKFCIAFAQFVKAHWKTIETVIFLEGDIDFCSLAASVSQDFFSSGNIPNRVKHFDVCFAECSDPNSAWFQLLNKQRSLEEIVVIERPNQQLTAALVATLCQNNFETLKYVSLISWTLDTTLFDLGIFSCCFSLEHLRFASDYGAGFGETVRLKNLGLLPRSVKVIHIASSANPPGVPLLDIEEIHRMSKFKNLAQIQIGARLQLSSEHLLDFVKALVRLPKLSFLWLKWIEIAESSDARQDCLETLEALNQANLEKSLTGSFLGIQFQEVKTPGQVQYDLHCKEFNGYLCQVRQAFMEDASGSIYATSSPVLPGIDQTGFEIFEK